MVRAERVDGDHDDVRLIVGPAEASPGDGRISYESPVGHALVGKKRGDKVTVKTPGGEIEMSITSVS